MVLGDFLNINCNCSISILTAHLHGWKRSEHQFLPYLNKLGALKGREREDMKKLHLVASQYQRRLLPGTVVVGSKEHLLLFHVFLSPDVL